MNRRPGPGRESQLSLRTTVILVAGLAMGALVGVLTFANGEPLPAAVLAGLPAAGATMRGLHQLIGKASQPHDVEARGGTGSQDERGQPDGDRTLDRRCRLRSRSEADQFDRPATGKNSFGR